MKHHILLLLLLAGCTPPPATPEVCAIEKVMDIPLAANSDLVTVPVTLDDQPATLIVASGSEASMVTPTAISTLRLHLDPVRRTTLTSIGGSTNTQNVLLRSMKVGATEMFDQSVSVGQLPVAPGPTKVPPNNPPNAGLLGADWLSGFEVELDLPHNRIALYRMRGCDGDYIPWLAPKSTVQATIYGRGLVLLNVTIDGHPFTAQIDTGVNHSLIGARAVSEAGLTPASLANDRAGNAIGTDLAVLHTRMHRFDTLHIGPLSYPNPEFAITDLRLRQSNLLLGTDWLRHNRVWISYVTHRVTIQPE